MAALLGADIDKATALAHFGDIDAVVTTFAVPHAAHIQSRPPQSGAQYARAPFPETEHHHME